MNMTVLSSFSLRQIESSAGRAAPHYELLVLVLICEAVLFYVQVATNIATLYPRHFDQVAYLTQVYELVHAYRSQGFEAALAYFRAIGSPSTTFFYPLGALFV